MFKSGLFKFALAIGIALTAFVIVPTKEICACSVPVGNGALGGVVVGPYFYSISNGVNRVSVMDTTTHTVIKSISLGASTPFLITAVGTKVYVANQDNTLSVINTTTKTISATIPIGLAPGSFATVGTKLYLTDGGGGQVHVINTTTDTLTQNITVGAGPTTMALSGTKLYVADTNADTVSVIDTNSDNVITTISVGLEPVDLVVANSKVYVANATGDTVSVINTTTDTVTATRAVGDNPLALTTANSKVYVANNGAGTVSVINTTTDAVASTITVGNGPGRIGTNGTKVYVSNQPDGTVSVVDATTDSILTNVTTGPGPQKAISVGAELFVPHSDGNIYIINANANALISSVCPVFISALSTPFFMKYVNGKLYVANITLPGLTVINPATNAVIATITTDASPNAIVVVDQNKIYTINDTSASVSVIDTNTDTVTATLAAVGGSTGAISNGKLFVPDPAGTDVKIFNATTNAFITTISTPPGAEELSNPVAAGANLLYLTDQNANSAASIDTVNNVFRPSISTGGTNPAQIIYTNGKIYITHQASDDVTVVNPTTNTVITNFASGVGGLGYVVDGTNLYVANMGENTVSVIDTVTDTLVTKIDVVNSPASLVRYGDYLFAGSYTDGLFSVIDMNDNSFVADRSSAVGSIDSILIDDKIFISNSTGNSLTVIDATHYDAPGDITAPIISETTPVPTPSTDTTPTYTFTTDEAGTITYGGSCSSITTAATIGTNTITFNTLGVGTYTNCTIRVTDVSTNASNLLAVSSFTITAPVVTPPATTPAQATGPVWGGEIDPRFIQTPAVIGPIGAGSFKAFPVNRNVGGVGADVKRLQQFLNAQGFAVAKNGPGSKGKETTIFGPATKTALIKFQKAHKIKPASGFFGPITRDLAGKLYR